MKVYVIGAHGNVGHLVVSQLRWRDTKLPLVLKPEQRNHLKKRNQTVHVDLLDKPEALAVNLDGYDAVVFQLDRVVKLVTI